MNNSYKGGHDFTVVTVGFNPTEYNVSEGDGVVMLTIERRRATAQPVIVTIPTNDLTNTGSYTY